MKKQLVISVSIFFFLALATLIVVLYGRGYRFQFQNGKAQLSGTGLLVVSSIPTGAEVLINGHLTTATDSTLNLLPGEYTIGIQKEGYFSWEKKLKIQKEVVAQADALLFPTAPKLENITTSGIDNPTIDPSQTQIAYTIASQSARKNGIYVLDMVSRPLLTLSSSTQIVDDTLDNFSKARLAWSPDGKQIIATIATSTRPTETTYLLKSGSLNDSPQDVTETLSTFKTAWQKDTDEKNTARLASFKLPLRILVASYFSVISWSPDDTKIFYQASESATIPIIIKPPLIGVNSIPEDRNIKKDMLYVYDTKEDRNYVLENVPPIIFGRDPAEGGIKPAISWFPDSKHLLYVHDKKIDILEYDGTNTTTVYAGPFIDTYVFPWPNGSKIVILTNLNNSSISPNLYTISLK